MLTASHAWLPSSELSQMCYTINSPFSSLHLHFGKALVNIEFHVNEWAESKKPLFSFYIQILNKCNMSIKIKFKNSINSWQHCSMLKLAFIKNLKWTGHYSKWFKCIYLLHLHNKPMSWYYGLHCESEETETLGILPNNTHKWWTAIFTSANRFQE